VDETVQRLSIARHIYLWLLSDVTG